MSDTVIEPILGTLVNPSSDAAIEPIYWVNGLAGIGKSTIVCMVAEDAKDRKLLGASFFFSRQENELSDPHLFIDRKSTRLNSSHQIISYAVFCLKKKKQIHFMGCR